MTCVNLVSCSSIFSKTGLDVVNESGGIIDEEIAGKLLVKTAEDNILVVNIADELKDPILVEFKNIKGDEGTKLEILGVTIGPEVIIGDEFGPMLEGLFVTIGPDVIFGDEFGTKVQDLVVKIGADVITGDEFGTIVQGLVVKIGPDVIFGDEFGTKVQGLSCDNRSRCNFWR